MSSVLLEYGAGINSRGNCDWTALITATSNGHHNTAPRESMRIFSGWVIVCGSCRTFVVCCRKGCPRLCTKFQVSSSTRTVRTSPCPGCPLLSQLELLPQHSAAPRCASALREICAYSLPDQGTLHFGNFYYFRLHVIPKWVRIYSLNPQGKEKSYSSNFDVQKKMCDFPPVSFKARRW